MLNVITLFSGYDSQCLALNRLGLPYDLVGWVEIDKHACTAHDALFPQFKGCNVGDVSRVDWAEWHRRHPQPIDLLTYSSPCQDFSSAGLQRGGEEGSGTRSGLLWETERAVRELRPRHLVFENVSGLVSDKFIDLFNRWQVRLNGYGYTNFAQLMNAKDYGCPQNRLRIFMVSVLDCSRAYYFPKPFKLERRLKDVLEQNVEERYYLSDERVEKLMQETAIHRDRGNGFAFRPKTPEEIASTVKCSGIVDKTDNYIAESKVLGWSRNEKGEITNRHPVSVADCITVAKRDTTQNYILEPTIAAMRGRDKDNPNDRGKSTDNYVQRLEPKPDGTSYTITSVAKDNLLIEPRSKRQESIKAKLMPNGDIRCDRDIPGKPGVSELQFTHPDNESPTVTCEAQVKVIEPTICGLPHGYYKGDIYTEYAPAVKSSAYAANNPLIEPSVLTPVRTEYGKAIRKQYGDNNLPESRHNLTQLQPKQDGTSNTHTSVAKDNLLIEPIIIDATNDFSEEEKRTYTEYSPALRSSRSGLMRTEGIRIRRLTERELYRLMDVDEEDIDTLLATPIPRTQHAKLAGNSIVVSCLYYIFRNLFVNTEPEAGTQTKLF